MAASPPTKRTRPLIDILSSIPGGASLVPDYLCWPFAFPCGTGVGCGLGLEGGPWLWLSDEPPALECEGGPVWPLCPGGVDPLSPIALPRWWPTALPRAFSRCFRACWCAGAELPSAGVAELPVSVPTLPADWPGPCCTALLCACPACWFGSEMPISSKAERAGFGTVTPAAARPASTSGISATAIPALATRARRERGRRTVGVSLGTGEAPAAAARRGTSVLPRLGSGWVGTAARSALS